jgi:hypothetical protein
MLSYTFNWIRKKVEVKILKSLFFFVDINKMFNNLGYQSGQNVQQHQQYFNQGYIYNNQINYQACASYEYNQSFSNQYNNQSYVNTK